MPVEMMKLLLRHRHLHWVAGAIALASATLRPISLLVAAMVAAYLGTNGVRDALLLARQFAG